MKSVIVVERWEEPEHGFSATVATLTDEQLGDLIDLHEWYKRTIEENFIEEYGNTFMELDILETKAVGGDYNMQELMEQLGDDMRYSSDDMYDEDSPIFTKYGIKRLTSD